MHLFTACEMRTHDTHPLCVAIRPVSKEAGADATPFKVIMTVGNSLTANAKALAMMACDVAREKGIPGQTYQIALFRATPQFDYLASHVERPPREGKEKNYYKYGEPCPYDEFNNVPYFPMNATSSTGLSDARNWVYGESPFALFQAIPGNEHGIAAFALIDYAETVHQAVRLAREQEELQGGWFIIKPGILVTFEEYLDWLAIKTKPQQGNLAAEHTPDDFET